MYSPSNTVILLWRSRMVPPNFIIGQLKLRDGESFAWDNGGGQRQ